MHHSIVRVESTVPGVLGEHALSSLYLRQRWFVDGNIIICYADYWDDTSSVSDFFPCFNLLTISALESISS